MVCVFFGHRNTPYEIEPILKATLCRLIEEGRADTFYVGDKGNFDKMVLKTLRELKLIYPQIVYGFVPAYQPTAKKEDDTTDYSDAVFPDEVLRSPAAYAISNRNRWLVKQADIVITYVTGIGYSADFKFMAERKNKEIIELSKLKDLIE